MERLEVGRDPFTSNWERDAHMIAEHRASNDGNLPKKEWLATLEAAGSYLCAELLIVSSRGNPVLKLRDDPTATAGEREWQGKYHIPGLSVGLRRAEDILPTLVRKEVSSVEVDKIVSNARLVAFARYPEPERKTVADTLIFLLSLTDELMSDLHGDFVEITGKNIETVIDQHKPVIKWYRDGMKSFLLDTRPE